MNCIEPKKEIIEKYELFITPFFEEINNLTQKNTLLRQTRDLLLPRLISGKLQVSEAVG